MATTSQGKLREIVTLNNNSGLFCLGVGIITPIYVYINPLTRMSGSSICACSYFQCSSIIVCNPLSECQSCNTTYSFT